MNPTSSEHTDSGPSLYRAGGIAALIAALMYVVALGIYAPAYGAGPPPNTTLEWFTLLQHSPLTGLFFLGLADIIIVILWGPMSLSLYFALRPTNRALLMNATTFVFVGMAVYLATNTAFSMLSLSNQYAVAATDAERSTVLAAGQAILAVSQGTGGQYVGMPLVWLAGVIISAVMLRSGIFHKATAWTGIFGLCLLLASVPFSGYTFGPTTGAMVTVAVGTDIGGGLLSFAWYILIGLRLLKLSSSR